MSAANWLLRIVPNTARPMVLPIERKNCRPAVTSPSRCDGYWFCTITVKALMATPSPRPMITMLRTSVIPVVATPMRDSRYAPAADRIEADDDDDLVLAGPGEDLPGADARDDRADHERHEDDAGVGRRLAEHALHEERQEHDGAEHGRRLQGAGDRRDA